jgi:hypothetical protein
MNAILAGKNLWSDPVGGPGPRTNLISIVKTSAAPAVAILLLPSIGQAATFSDADWTSLGSGMGGYGSSTAVYALASIGTNLYVGGFFSTAGGVRADYLAKWDGNTWSSLGGVSGVISNTTPSVFALAVNETDLYVGGDFSMAGGVSATNIAKWNGSAWSALGSGIPGGVRALAVSGTNLYAGGGFTIAGGVPANGIARWDGSAWSALGSGIKGGPSPGIRTLVVSGTNLYAGGWFTTAGGVTVNGIAVWNGSAWSALGSEIGSASSIVNALAVSGTDLYAGGYFTGGMYIAKWDGTAWSPLGAGMNNSVSALAANGIDLYASGQFTNAGEGQAWYIAKWNGCTWSALGSGLGGADYLNAQALAADGAGHLFVGGNFTRAGTNTCQYIAQANVGPSVPPAPVIVGPPTNQNTLIGGTADFSVVACSTVPMGYQWLFGTSSMPGETNSVLHLTNVQPSQAGVYAVLVTNLYGAATSAPATLDVLRVGIVVAASEPALRAAMSQGGTVTFACDGTIALSSAITNTTDTVLDGRGHQITISGGGAARLFVVNTNVNFSVASLTLSDGASLGGSAVLNLGGTVNLTGVTLRSNTAPVWGNNNDALTPKGNGGAIFNRGGTVNATNCAFAGNRVQTFYGSPGNEPTDVLLYGGAIRNENGQLNLRSCSFISNQASGGDAFFPVRGDPARGAAIHNSGTATLDLCTFAGNSAKGGAGGTGSSGYSYQDGGAGGEGSGGALYNEGALNIDRSSLSTNTATAGNGGMGGRGDINMNPNGSRGGNGGSASGGAICSLGPLWVTRSTLVSNIVTAGAGGTGGSGAVFMDIGGNGGDAGGGGSGLGGAVSGGGGLVNCTIAFNTGAGGVGGTGGPGTGYRGTWGNGGAGGNGGSGLGGVAGTCNLTNCTLAGNLGVAGPGGPGGSAVIGIPGQPGTSGSASGGTVCGPMPNTLIAANTPAGGDTFPDPKLGPLADNGGPTLTMALLPGSPAIDAGNTALAPATDQRGYPRPAGLAADIGAFEFGSVMPMLAVSRSGATTLNLLATGNSNQPCRLLVSSNLSDWTPIATNQIGGDGTFLFHDNCASGGACRFYRLIML